MTEIILVLTVSLTSIGLLIWLAVMGTKFIKHFAEVVEEILDEQKKINRCVECNTPLKHIANNKWMCDQSPSNCKMSIKVIFLDNPVQEEE